MMQPQATLEIPDVPTIPGLRFRGFRGEADFVHMTAIFNACMAADGIDLIHTVEDTAWDSKPREGFDPQRDLIFAEMDGEPNGGLVAYSSLQHGQEEHGDAFYHSNGYVLPAWRRRGIGRAMLHYNNALSRKLAAENPPGKPCVVEAFAAEKEVGAGALLLGEGYEPKVYFASMVRADLDNIPSAPMPEGLEVRPVEPGHYRAIWEADAEAFRDHWGYVPRTEEDYQRWLDDPIGFQPELWKIAWEGDQVAGQVKGFINRDENEAFARRRGYVEFISVRRSWRRRGLARALIVQSLHELKARGMTEAALSVHTDNPNGAFHLYESVGFRQIRASILYQKPMD